MTQKKNLIYIKTASELNQLYNSDKTSVIKSDNIVFAPDMDGKIFWHTRINQNSNSDWQFFSKLVDNTIKHNSATENLAFANRLGELLKEYWDMAYRFGNTHWNAADLRKRAEYTPFEIIIRYASERDLFGRGWEFNKSISPEIQILLNKSGFLDGTYNYNFSSQRLEDKEFIMTVLPKQNGYNFLSSNDRKLLDKFERDFGRTFNPKTAFRGATDPELLYEIRSGRINPTLGLEKLTQNDTRFIIPRNDFNSLSPSDIYDVLTNGKIKWEPWQVYSLMQLMIDKVPNENNEEYFEQITAFLTRNGLFSKPTSDNYKLWMQFNDKFRTAIAKDKSAHTELKQKLADMHAQLQKNTSELAPINEQLRTLYTESISESNLRDKIKRIRSFNTEYFNKHTDTILDAVNNATQSGQYQKLEKPEKPWKLFGFDKEKKQYQELLDLVAQVNEFLDTARENRDNIFGEHNFSAIDKQNKLSRQQHQISQDISTLSKNIEHDEFYSRFTPKYEKIKEALDKQTTSKKARMEKAAETLKTRGVKFGEKSGVVLADKNAEKILFNRAIEKTMEKLRKTPANEKKSDQELMEIAIRLVKEKQK